MAELRAAFPGGPLVDADGNITPAWRGFFQSLYTRTGGAPGASSDTSGVQAELDAEASARAATDVALATAIAAERSERQSADNDEATQRASADAQRLSLAGGTVSGPVRLNGGLGVLGAGAVTARPVVTGSRGSNVALAALLSALASYGFITDSTTA
jgi:hypothetical protein